MGPFKGPPAWDLMTCAHFLAVGTDLTEPGYFKRSHEKVQVLIERERTLFSCEGWKHESGDGIKSTSVVTLRGKRQHEPVEANKQCVLAQAARAKFNSLLKMLLEAPLN